MMVGRDSKRCVRKKTMGSIYSVVKGTWKVSKKQQKLGGSSNGSNLGLEQETGGLTAQPARDDGGGARGWSSARAANHSSKVSKREEKVANGAVRIGVRAVKTG